MTLFPLREQTHHSAAAGAPPPPLPSRGSSLQLLLEPLQRASVLLAQVGADERAGEAVAHARGLDLVGEAHDGAAVLRLQLVDALRVAAPAAAAAALLDDAVGGGLDRGDVHPA